MRLSLRYPLIAHAAFVSILTMACVDPEQTTQPVKPITVGAVQPNPRGIVEVTVTTTGSDLDPNGYVILGSRPSDSEGVSLYGALPVNGSATLSGPADTYEIRLAEVAPNCDLVTPAPQKFVVAKDGVTKLSIHLQCTNSLQLTYSIGRGSAAADSPSLARQFWIMDLTGRNATKLTTDAASHEAPTWSPDGSRMAFASDRGGRAGIWVMEANGEAVTLNTGLREDFGPRWSPDGNRLVFFSPIEGMTQLFSVNADGTQVRAITTGSPGDFDPDWSPDGKKIAFASKRDDIPGIWVINADGTDPIRLTSRDDSKPVWSPDGATIAFSRVDWWGNQYGLYTMNADGSVPVVRGRLTYPVHPAWSPNGRKIAFSTTPCPRDTCYEFIQFVSLDGTGYTPITIPGVSGDVAWRQRH